MPRAPPALYAASQESHETHAANFACRAVRALPLAEARPSPGSHRPRRRRGQPGRWCSTTSGSPTGGPEPVHQRASVQAPTWLPQPMVPTVHVSRTLAHAHAKTRRSQSSAVTATACPLSLTAEWLPRPFVLMRTVHGVRTWSRACGHHHACCALRKAQLPPSLRAFRCPLVAACRHRTHWQRGCT